MKQEVVRPTDAFVLIYLTVGEVARRTYAEMAAETALAVSAVHASVGRLREAGLLDRIDAATVVRRSATIEFLVRGARYCYPPMTLSDRRGVVTGLHALEHVGELSRGDSRVHVWPDPSGDAIGIGLLPLSKAVPAAVSGRTSLHETLALFDLLRTGAARERSFATDELHARLDG